MLRKGGPAEIISELENAPRGVYTGCIGYISPASGPSSPSCEAGFSVAIRTIILDPATGTGHLGIGSGITWDSGAGAEYMECLAKANFARHTMPDFQLIETMLFEEKAGCVLLDRHLERLHHSASYFGFRFRPKPVRKALAERLGVLAQRTKVRLLLSPDGTFTLESEPILPEASTVLPTAFATVNVDSSDPFLYHKTTNRELYLKERALRPDCAEVIFVNQRGEVTEGTTTTIIARVDGHLVTPPVHCGLLPGVFRQQLLEQGVITERVITRQELEQAHEFHLVNSVRKWRRATLL